MSHEKAFNHAQECIHRCNALIPALEATQAAYLDLLGQYEKEMQILRMYQRRGIISQEDMPKYNKKKLPETLKAARQKKRS